MGGRRGSSLPLLPPFGRAGEADEGPNQYRTIYITLRWDHPLFIFQSARSLYDRETITE